MRERADKPNSQHEALEQAIIRGVGWGLGIPAVVALYALSWLPVVLEQAEQPERPANWLDRHPTIGVTK